MDKRDRLLVLGLAVLAYLPVLGGPFNFDDIATVLRNPGVSSWGRAFHGLVLPWGRGLFWISMAADATLSGSAPRPGLFHLTSLLVHLLNTALLMSLVAALSRLRGEEARRPALATGLLFALHPLASSAVCYISQRSILLAATGLLVCLHALVRMADPGTGTLGRRLFGILAFAAWIAGIQGKETGIVIPFCALACIPLLPDGRGKDSVIRWTALAVPLCLAAGAWGFFAQVMEVPYFRTHWDLYGMTQCRIVWHYLGLAVLPFGQSADPDPLGSVGWLLPPTTLLGGLALAALVVLLFRLRRRAPWVSAGGLLALISLLPESSVVGLPDLMFEYRTYLCVIGLVLAAVPLLAFLSRRPVPLRICLACLLCLTCLTAARATVWRSEPGLWREAMRQAPRKLRVHSNLSVRYYELALRAREAGYDFRSVRLFEAAERLIRRGIRIKPVPEQYRDLALIALDRHDEAGGLAALAEAERLKPGFPEALPIRGRLRLVAGHYPEAAEALARARVLYPRDDSILFDLVTAQALAGQPVDAAALAKGLETAKGPRVLLLLGSTLAGRGDLPSAERLLSRYVAREPADPIGWANLAQVYRGQGRAAEAREASRRAAAACGNDPAYAEMKRSLATD